MLPDTCFHTGELKYIVPGNECRLLDHRRTPLHVVEVKPSTGFLVVEILDFEDQGGSGSSRLRAWAVVSSPREAWKQAEPTSLAAEIIARLDRPLMIPADPSQRTKSEASIISLRRDARTWLEHESIFVRSGASLGFSQRTGEPALWSDVERYMTEEGLWDIEQAFADTYVRSFHFGELVKGHRIVLAELGLVSFEGKQVRDPGLFEGVWSKQRRADHILHRLAFVREMFERRGHSTVVLYRGSSFQGKPEAPRNDGFMSATFSLEVAMSHFNEGEPTGVLLRQSVAVERLFMSYLETAQMNDRYKEAEAVLLHDVTSELFDPSKLVLTGLFVQGRI